MPVQAFSAWAVKDSNLRHVTAPTLYVDSGYYSVGM
jgi:hypothetical protein